MSIEGKVARINPSVDSSSRTFQVETLVPNERGLLRPGGFAKASIITDAEAKAAVVPSIRSSGSPASPSSSSSRTARHDRSATSRPAPKGAVGSRSPASSSRRRPPSSPRGKPNFRRDARRDPRARARQPPSVEDGRAGSHDPRETAAASAAIAALSGSAERSNCRDRRSTSESTCETTSLSSIRSNRLS